MNETLAAVLLFACFACECSETEPPTIQLDLVKEAVNWWIESGNCEEGAGHVLIIPLRPWKVGDNEGAMYPVFPNLDADPNLDTVDYSIFIRVVLRAPDPSSQTLVYYKVESTQCNVNGEGEITLSVYRPNLSTTASLLRIRRDEEGILGIGQLR